MILSIEREVLAKRERKSSLLVLLQMQNWINPNTNPTVYQSTTVAQVKVSKIIFCNTWLLIIIGYWYAGSDLVTSVLRQSLSTPPYSLQLPQHPASVVSPISERSLLQA